MRHDWLKRDWNKLFACGASRRRRNALELASSYLMTRRAFRQAGRVERLEARQLLTTFVVTTATDVVDGNDGVLSLREALTQAQTSTTDDVITFSGSARNFNGLVWIKLDPALNQLEYHGSGAGALTIDGDIDGDDHQDVIVDGNRTPANAGSTSRVLYADNVTSLTLDAIQLRGGIVRGAGGGAYITGAKGALASTVAITILNSSIGASIANSRGGLYVYANGGTFTMSNTILSSSSSSGDIGGMELHLGGGTVHLTDNSILGNSGKKYGGFLVSADNVSLEDNLVSINETTAGFGGGRIISVSPNVTLVNNKITSNTATDYAGISLSADNGTVVMTGNTFEKNAASNSRGGFDLDVGTGSATLSKNIISKNTGKSFAGGEISVSTGSVLFDENTITGNTASYRTGGMQLEITAAGTATFSNNTVSDNKAYETAGITFDQNGGRLTVIGNTVAQNSASQHTGGFSFNLTGGQLLVANNTVVNNSANYWAGADVSAAAGAQATLVNNTIIGNQANTSTGGLQLQGAVTLNNNIVAGNSAPQDADIGNGAASPNSANNLIGNSASAGGLVNGVNGNIVGVDWTTVVQTTVSNGKTIPKLAANGGPTQTVALIEGSAALDGGNKNKSVDLDGNPLAYDQRGQGYPRVLHGQVDMGAFELAFSNSPVIGNFSGTVNYPPGGSPILISSNATISDPDSPDFGGGQMVIRYEQNAQSTDRLGILSQGTGAGQIGISGSNVTYGGVVIGQFNGGVGTQRLQILLNEHATVAAAQALLRRITFSNTTPNPPAAPRKVVVAIDDGDGGRTATASKTITIV